ncbi:retrovirus-related pol polyprotein from transposon TNT 1-94 [Tanacetum coccineum]
MLIFSKSPLFLWAEAVDTGYYTQHKSLFHTRYNKTPYELLRNWKPDIKFFHVFGALCYPTNDGDDLRKLKPKADIGIFIGYSPSKKAYRIYNKQTLLIMETIHLQFDELTQMASKQNCLGPEPQPLTSGHISSGLVPNQVASTSAKPPLKNDLDLLFQPMFDEYFKPSPSVVSMTISVVTLLPQDISEASSSTIIDQDAPSPSTTLITKTTTTPIQSTNVEEPNNKDNDAKFDSDTFTNPFAPLVTSSAESSSSRIELVLKPSNVMIINLKWIFKVRLDGYGGMLKMKAQLVVKGYHQEEGIDFEEFFCAGCTYRGSSHLHCLRCPQEYDNVSDGRKDCFSELLKKALYGLKQAPRAWYDLLSKFLLSHKFVKHAVNLTLFTRKEGDHILLVQIYVDDIIFASTNPTFYEQFVNKMSTRFKMSMMGKISSFLGLQISENPRGIFTLEMLKKYGLENSDVVDTPMVKRSKLDEGPQGTPVDPTHYRTMVGSLMYLIASHPNLVFILCMCVRYQAKPTEKHLTAVKRVFWLPRLEKKYFEKCILTNYGFDFNKIPLYNDSKSVIALSCNTIQHSRTKHIAARYHFIMKQVKNEVVELYFVKTAYQLTNIFTKALARERFEFLINNIGMKSIMLEELKSLAESDEE